jgi:hypothetical protein
MKYAKILVTVCTLVVSSSLHATTYNVTPEYSAGSGANKATLVVDFGTGSRAFDYHWDGVATSWDALHAVDLAGSLGVNASIDPTWGAFVSRITYPGSTAYNYGPAAVGWSYFTSADGSLWNAPGNGASFNTLLNGDWNAWVWSNYDADWNIVRHPGDAAVPEPMTLALLGFGGVMLRRRAA